MNTNIKEVAIREIEAKSILRKHKTTEDIIREILETGTSSYYVKLLAG